MKDNIDLVVIDYLHLITTKNKLNREDELNEISLRLKKLPDKLNIPIIVTAQLSRTCEHREDKRPILTDFIESKGIIEYANTIMFLYRDDYYNKESEKRNIAEINIAKNKNGKLGTVELVFLDKYCKFANIEYKE